MIIIFRKIYELSTISSLGKTIKVHLNWHKNSLELGLMALILAHNHNCLNINLITQDLSMTEKFVTCAVTLDILISDDLIVS